MKNENTAFVPPSPLKTPVLFLIFNRLDTTKQVFEAIRKAKPPRLYIAADGARASKAGEEEKVKAVREFVINNIDWNCEVKTLFRNENLGCGLAVSEAITWFFENEEMGIILEDDCLPVQSFFWFCEELLERYKDDMRVWQISGDNYQNGKKRGVADYYFSIYSHIWGWASWADRWSKYDFKLNSLKDNQFIDSILRKPKAIEYWKNIFNIMKEKPIDTWDYQWLFTIFYFRGLVILPNMNLVANIGFGDDSTHTRGEINPYWLKKFDVVIKNHPKEIKQNIKADNYTFNAVYNSKSLLQRVVFEIRKRLFFL